MVDRYSAYKAMLQVKNGTLILVFCWAHVRRDFVRVGKGWPELKSWALQWLRRIRDLYRWHRQRLANRHPGLAAAAAGCEPWLQQLCGAGVAGLAQSLSMPPIQVANASQPLQGPRLQFGPALAHTHKVAADMCPAEHQDWVPFFT